MSLDGDRHKSEALLSNMYLMSQIPTLEQERGKKSWLFALTNSAEREIERERDKEMTIRESCLLG